jgi:hypothetical protein
MRTGKGIADHIFAYPDLEPSQKLEFERTVAPFDLELTELKHLLSTPFPFDDRTRRWLELYVELSEIHQQQGTLPDLDRTMSAWATKQRTYRNQGRLPLERERALNRIGFVWNVKEALWQRQYEGFLAYRNNPQAKTTGPLRNWMSTIREKWDQLTPRQQRLLQEAGLVRQPFADKAQGRLQELEAFFARQGHLRGLSEKLGKFVFRLRERYQAGKLDPEEQKRCDRMGLKWFASDPAARWSNFYARAAAYVQQFGSAIPVWKWPDRELSQWVGKQTGHWAKLSDEKRKLLQKLQIKTEEEQHQELWDRRYAQAVVLHTRLGPFRKRVYQNEDELLKGWMRRQRLKWDELSERQREQLKAIGLEKKAPQQRIKRAKPSPNPFAQSFIV